MFYLFCGNRFFTTELYPALQKFIRQWHIGLFEECIHNVAVEQMFTLFLVGVFQFLLQPVAEFLCGLYLVFAKELVKVLSKYQVSFSDKLTELKLASLPIPEPNESQLEQLYETSNKISSICRDSTWIKDPNRAVPVSLRNDLLVTIVNYCPHSLARVEAAKWLVERKIRAIIIPKGFMKRLSNLAIQVFENAELPVLEEEVITYKEDQEPVERRKKIVLYDDIYIIHEKVKNVIDDIVEHYLKKEEQFTLFNRKSLAL